MSFDESELRRVRALIGADPDDPGRPPDPAPEELRADDGVAFTLGAVTCTVYSFPDYDDLLAFERAAPDWSGDGRTESMTSPNGNLLAWLRYPADEIAAKFAAAAIVETFAGEE